MKCVSRRLAFQAILAAVLVMLACFAPLAAERRAAAQDDGVILLVNARNPTVALSTAEAKKLFLGQTAFWHGVVPVRIVVRPDASQAAKAFYPLLGETPQSFQKQWNELQLAGRGITPKALGTIQEVADIVAKTPGGLGYALASEAWNLQLKGVKTIPVR